MMNARRQPHTRTSKGYTLLFAVIVSVLVLSIAAFILSVSRKQAILVSSARDSIYAFYAADSGLECAIQNLSSLATSSDGSTIRCAGLQQGVVRESHQDGATIYGTSSFAMSVNGSAGNSQSGISSCASTTVAYTYTPAEVTCTQSDPNDPSTETCSVTTPASGSTVVESRGYNIGWNGVGCGLPGPRKVERALRYTQYQ